jgi:hypothetical protein
MNLFNKKLLEQQMARYDFPSGKELEKIQETNPFVQLLWDKGMQHEKEVVGRLI